MNPLRLQITLNDEILTNIEQSTGWKQVGQAVGLVWHIFDKPQVPRQIIPNVLRTLVLYSGPSTDSWLSSHTLQPVGKKPPLLAFDSAALDTNQILCHWWS